MLKEEELKEKVLKLYEEREGDKSESLKSRLDLELRNICEEKGWSELLLLSYDVANAVRAENPDAFISIRGRLGSSYVVHLLGLSTIIPTGSEFEIGWRQLYNYQKGQGLDIDFNMSKESREIAIDYLIERFGEVGIPYALGPRGKKVKHMTTIIIPGEKKISDLKSELTPGEYLYLDVSKKDVVDYKYPHIDIVTCQYTKMEAILANYKAACGMNMTDIIKNLDTEYSEVIEYAKRIGKTSMPLVSHHLDLTNASTEFFCQEDVIHAISETFEVSIDEACLIYKDMQNAETFIEKSNDYKMKLIVSGVYHYVDNAILAFKDIEDACSIKLPCQSHALTAVKIEKQAEACMRLEQFLRYL